MTDEETRIEPGKAAAHLAATIASASEAPGPDEGLDVRLVLRLPLGTLRAVEKLATLANRSRNHMGVQLLLAGLDGVLAALPEDKRDQVLLAAMTVEEDE
jgi:hypothetical protein